MTTLKETVYVETRNYSGNFPVAYCTLNQHKRRQSWRVEKCPSCGKEEYFEAGRTGIDDPRAMLGVRTCKHNPQMIKHRVYLKEKE